jgi:chemotaxis protein MotB
MRFVTAMMAFFLLMWLLSTTDERRSSRPRDYFARHPDPSTTAAGTGWRPRFQPRAGAGRADASAADKTKPVDQPAAGRQRSADPLLAHRTRLTDEG